MGMKVIEIDKKREELIEIAKKYTWFNTGHEQSVYEEPGKISVSQSGNYFTDIFGNTYLEALGGFAGCTLGRSNSYIIEAMVEESLTCTYEPTDEVETVPAVEAIPESTRPVMRKVCPPSVLGSVLDSFVAENDGTVV